MSNRFNQCYRRNGYSKRSEIFAAVFPIISFDTAEEAVKIANQSSYGLSGAVFSSDVKKAICVAAKMKAGGVVINGGSCFRTPDLAFGGFKKAVSVVKEYPEH